MASSLMWFRRGLRILSGLNQSSSAASTSLWVPVQGSVSSSGSRWESANVGVQSRSFMSKSISLLSARSSQPQMNFPDNIGPDTILFEGCDYNHWLFVMDFPKDIKLPPEEMIRVYEETCAKGLNISVEEAKKKIYACSTTTYTGFQAVMTEEESKIFEGLSGVIFVLPDSYIDPVNKEYGGDKYIDGTIIPRPPPVQYGRNQGRRDRNRSPDQYNRQENPMLNPEGNPSYNNRASVPGDGRNYGPSQSYPPQQNYGQASQNYPPQQNYGQASQSYPPRQNYGQASQQGYPPQQSHGQASPNYPPRQNYGPASQNYPPQQNFNQAPQNYTPQPSHGQASQSYPPQQNINQASQNYPPQQSHGQASQSYPPQQNINQTSQNYPPRQQTYGSASPQYAQQQSFGPPGQAERRNYVPQQNFGRPEQGERTEFPREGRDNTIPPSYAASGFDFKPSYLEEFEQNEKGNYLSKEQTGSQQRYPPPGHGNFTGEGRY